MQHTFESKFTAEQVAEGLELYARSQGWTEEIPSEDGTLVPHPMTAKAFGYQMLKEYILHQITKYQQRVSATAAKQQAAADVAAKFEVRDD